MMTQELLAVLCLATSCHVNSFFSLEAALAAALSVEDDATLRSRKPIAKHPSIQSV